MFYRNRFLVNRFLANKNSKTQQAKKAWEKEHPTRYIGCCKCGERIATLHSIGEGKYLCSKCYAKANPKTDK